MVDVTQSEIVSHLVRHHHLREKAGIDITHRYAGAELLSLFIGALHQDAALIGPVRRLAAFGPGAFLNIASCRLDNRFNGIGYHGYAARHQVVEVF